MKGSKEAEYQDQATPANQTAKVLTGTPGALRISNQDTLVSSLSIFSVLFSSLKN